jgi:hypothetical protein
MCKTQSSSYESLACTEYRVTNNILQRAPKFLLLLFNVKKRPVCRGHKNRCIFLVCFSTSFCASSQQGNYVSNLHIFWCAVRGLWRFRGEDGTGKPVVARAKRDRAVEKNSNTCETEVMSDYIFTHACFIKLFKCVQGRLHDNEHWWRVVLMWQQCCMRNHVRDWMWPD